MIDKANILLTHNCNLKCLHCYIDAGVKKENFLETYEKTIKLLKKLKKDNIKSIMFTGGECLVFPKIKELVKHAKKIGFNVSVFTNGMIYDEELFDLADTINISLDGPEEIHNYIRQNNNSYNNVIKVLDYLKKKDKYTVIQLTVNNYNYKKLDFLPDLLINYLNVRVMKFVFVSNYGRAKQNEIYYENNYINFITEKLEEFYKRTKYHIQFVTNIIDEYSFVNYYISGDINFPIWFDIPGNEYYFFVENRKFRGIIENYSFKKASKYNNHIKRAIKKGININQIKYTDFEKLISESLKGDV